jgi:hypothetical protein
MAGIRKSMKKIDVSFVYLLLSLVIGSLLFNIAQYIELKNMHLELNDLKFENHYLLVTITSLEAKNKELKDYFDEQIFGVGCSLRKMLTLRYYRAQLGYPPVDVGQLKAVIYVFEDDSTIELTLEAVTHPGLFIPLTIQKGDATHPDYATEIDEKNPKIRYAPILWSEKVNASRIYLDRISASYKIPLKERGWYTISFTEKIRFPGGQSLPGVAWQNGKFVVLPVSLSLDIRISTKDKYWTPFAVNEVKTFDMNG